MTRRLQAAGTLALAAAVALALGACGGGGGGDGDAALTDGGGGDHVDPVPLDGSADTGPAPYPISPSTRMVSGDSYADPRGASLAFDSTGATAMAVWVVVRSDGPAGSTVLYSLYSEGAWSAEAAVANADGYMYFPSVAFATGAFMVAYERDGHYFARRFVTASGAWEAEVQLDTATAMNMGSIKVASDGTGFAAVWGQDDGGAVATMVSRYDAGAWSTPVALSAAGQATSEHQIAGNVSGYAVAWQQGPSIFAAVYAASAWGAAKEIDQSAPNPTPAAYRPRIAASNSGYAVVWQQGTGTINVHASVYSGGAWGGVFEIDGTTTSLPTAEPQIASNGSNYAVAWLQPASGPTGPTALLYANIYNGTWAGAARVDDSSWLPCKAHQIASNGSGWGVTWIRGNSTAGEVVASVNAGIWGTATALESEATVTGAPALGGRAGAYVAVWPQRTDAGRAVYARRWVSGGWAAATNLATARYVGSATEPKIAADGAGGRLAVWEQYDDTVELVYGSFYSADGWGTPFVVAGDAATGSYAAFARVAASATGYAVVWRQDNDLYARTYADSAWGDPALLEVGTVAPQMAFYQAVASNGTGYAVVWTQGDGVFANVYSGGAWGGATLLESLTGTASRPVVASNGTGYAAAWHQNDGTVNRIYGAVFDGASWSAAEALEDGSGAAVDARIASNGVGYAVVWVQHDGTENRAYANTRTGTLWTGAVRLDVGDAAASAVRVAGRADGYLATWAQSDGSTDRVYVSRCDGSDWSAPRVIDAGDGTAGGPEVAAGATGYAVVWPHTAGGVTDFVGNVYNGVWGQAARLESVNADVAAKYRYEVAAAGDGYCAVWTQPNPADTPNATTQRIWAAGF